jgi:hypothetical protein
VWKRWERNAEERGEGDKGTKEIKKGKRSDNMTNK